MKLTQEEKQIIEKYGHLYINTGGNNIVELLEREGVTYFNNQIVAKLQGSCYSQTILLIKLSQLKLLID